MTPQPHKPLFLWSSGKRVKPLFVYIVCCVFGCFFFVFFFFSSSQFVSLSYLVCLCLVCMSYFPQRLGLQYVFLGQFFFSIFMYILSYFFFSFLCIEVVLYLFSFLFIFIPFFLSFFLPFVCHGRLVHFTPFVNHTSFSLMRLFYFPPFCPF